MNSELYEAASVDRAGVLRKVWHVTLPQIRGVLLVTLILQIIGTASSSSRTSLPQAALPTRP